jgi:hypothetical protein
VVALSTLAVTMSMGDCLPPVVHTPPHFDRSLEFHVRIGPTPFMNVAANSDDVFIRILSLVDTLKVLLSLLLDIHKD